MNSNEQALRAVRAQAQFEVAEIALQVAQAATHAAREQRRATLLMRRCESIASELRSAVTRTHLNPALISAMQLLHQDEHVRLQHVQARLATAREREQQARTALAGVRNRQRSLERALKAERRKRQLKQQALEAVRVDDLWLQHAWRDMP